MRTDSDILQEMGKLLWSIFRTDANRAVFMCRSFPESTGGETTIQFFSSEGALRKSDGEATPFDIWDRMRDLTRDLQLTPPFDRQPFTHMRLELTDQTKMNVEFAYIPEWDSWPGLFMRGVSDVPEDEAKQRPRFYKAWKECRARREREPYQK